MSSVLRKWITTLSAQLIDSKVEELDETEKVTSGGSMLIELNDVAVRPTGPVSDSPEMNVTAPPKRLSSDLTRSGVAARGAAVTLGENVSS
jgi:hypothetical protein